MPTVRVDDTELFYQDHDFADPWAPHDTVFMQHGFARNSNFWRAWVPRLSRHYRVVRMDLRGCGQSGDPGPEYSYTMEGFLRDFTGFLDAAGIDRVHYVGESLGGIIGAAAAAHFPDRFHSLTLISTPLGVPENSARLATEQLGYKDWGDAIRSLGMKGWWRAHRSSTGELLGGEADEYFASEFARTPVHIAVALTKMPRSVNIGDLLAKITVPTLILSPGASPRAPQQQQADIARTIPQARQKVYEGAKHSIFFLMPDIVAQDTLEFLRSL